MAEHILFYTDDFYRRERRLRVDKVVFAGPREVADKLREQLQSSAAQELDDRLAAKMRQAKRDEKFIAKAQASLLHEEYQCVPAPRGFQGPERHHK